EIRHPFGGGGLAVPLGGGACRGGGTKLFVAPGRPAGTGDRGEAGRTEIRAQRGRRDRPGSRLIQCLGYLSPWAQTSIPRQTWGGRCAYFSVSWEFARFPPSIARQL